MRPLLIAFRYALLQHGTIFEPEVLSTTASARGTGKNLENRLSLQDCNFHIKNMLKSFPWAVAIIAARETLDTLARTIRAAEEASAGKDAIIDVLVNGNPDLAREAGAWVRASARGSASVRVWFIARGDKAHAWNEYVHRIWPAGRTAFFLDGYAQPKPDGLTRLEASLAQDANVLGATGVPSSGRSAPSLRERMVRDGGFHGNMHAISADAMMQLCVAGVRLPLGLYRTDSLIGAILLFRLDPSSHQWDRRRIVVNPEATWNISETTGLSLKNAVGQFKRRLRQAQGDLENRAVRDHLSVRRAPVNAMPKTARELVLAWIDANPGEAKHLYMRNPFRLYAANKQRAPQDWTAADRAPEMVCEVKHGVEAGRAGAAR